MSNKPKIDDGGPVHPVWDTDEHRQPYTIREGISVRDYFAAQALQGVVWNWHEGGKPNDTPEKYAEMVSHCYMVADAMIKARQP